MSPVFSSFISKMPIIFGELISTVENCSGIPKEKKVVLIVADIALRVFLSKKYWILLPLVVWYTVTSVGSPEEETLKSTGSSIKNVTLPEAVDVTIVLLGTYRAKSIRSTTLLLKT